MITNKVYVVTTYNRGMVTRSGTLIIYDRYPSLPETRKQMNDVIATLLDAKQKFKNIIIIKTIKV